uniref:Uncharacterized protein n=1 Tax=Glossina pallidipes TaxID=7398 RepID=A0A1A9ZMH8_GLOPL
MIRTYCGQCSTCIREKRTTDPFLEFIALPSSSSDSEISESELSSEIASPCMGFIVIVKAESSQRAMDTPLKRITENTQTSIISVVGCELSAAKYKGGERNVVRDFVYNSDTNH